MCIRVVRSGIPMMLIGSQREVFQAIQTKSFLESKTAASGVFNSHFSFTLCTFLVWSTGVLVVLLVVPYTDSCGVRRFPIRIHVEYEVPHTDSCGVRRFPIRIHGVRRFPIRIHAEYGGSIYGFMRSTEVPYTDSCGVRGSLYGFKGEHDVLVVLFLISDASPSKYLSPSLCIHWLLATTL